MNTSAAWPLLWLVAIVAMIPLALWLLKRSPIGAGLAGSQGVRVTGSTPLGPQQRIVTVEVGQGQERRWLVLGVTPQQISALHVLATSPVAVDSNASGDVAIAAPSFQALFERLRKGGRDAR